ncbi:MAG: LysE family transporter [Bacteroidetes bacterium]|nr:LysE family transporter [Bacteroidota bacterium]
MILKAIFQGLLLGSVLAIQPGPSLFTLIQTSSKKGFKSGFALAIGIFLSDVICVLLAYLGIAQLFDNPNNKMVIGLIGGTLLIVFGLFSIFHKKKEEEEKGIVVKAVNVPLFITKGFFLNILNPSVIFLWILWVGAVSSNKEFTRLHISLFFITTLAIVFITDVLKAYFANKISKHLSHKILRKISILLGIILLVTGLVFIYRVVSVYF